MRKGKVWIDATRRKGRLSPFVYGSFIEHLGRCVYGGIWAEKIRNGKFAGEDPNHCGVIYPWLPFGEQKGRNVYFTHDNTCFYVGSQSQRVEIMAPGTMAGIFQDIIVDDCAFKVRCVLRGEGIGNPVWVRLQRGEEVFVETGLEVGPDWKVFDFEWKVTPVLFRKEVSFVIAFEGPGTLWVGYVSMMPINRSWKGMRKDVLSAIRMLRPTILRWPGGNFASNYHWMDGVGPRDKRPPRWDRAWSTWEPNDFGTDEFMELCRFVGAEPYICVNIGTGTPEEAAAWVEYCNGDPSSRYGSLRAENGHPEPYSVRFWGIGNETYGNWQIGHVDPETYGKKCLEFVRTMKAVDPNIVLVAVGVNEVGRSSGADFYPWNKRVLMIVNDAIDYLSAHHYVPGAEFLQALDKKPSDEELYYPIVGFSEEMKHILAENIRVLDCFSSRKRIDLAYDEWNVSINGLEENYLLRDGLYVAGMFHAFFLFPERVRITNIAQLVNALGVISTNETSVLLTPLYWAFKLYRDHFGSILLESGVECDTFSIPSIGAISENEAIPLLDAAASCDEEGKKIFLAVINRHRSEPIETQIEVLGVPVETGVKKYELNGCDALDTNSFEQPSRVRVRSSFVDEAGNKFIHLFLPHSVSILEFRVCTKE